MQTVLRAGFCALGSGLILMLGACGGMGTSPAASAQHEWAWMGGSQNLNATGSYGQMGIASAGNTPGARNFAVAWVNSSGDPMLYGGLGLST